MRAVGDGSGPTAQMGCPGLWELLRGPIPQGGVAGASMLTAGTPSPWSLLGKEGSWLGLEPTSGVGLIWLQPPSARQGGQGMLPGLSRPPSLPLTGRVGSECAAQVSWPPAPTSLGAGPSLWSQAVGRRSALPELTA